MPGRNEESRFGPEIPITVDGGNVKHKPRTYEDGSGIYDHPRASRPGNATIVEGGIQPFDSMTRSQRLKTFALAGGPLDGVELDLPQTAMVHQATVPNERQSEPFAFDEAAFKAGKPNIVQGEFDTALYRRTNQKNSDGLTILAYVSNPPAESIDSVNLQPVKGA